MCGNSVSFSYFSDFRLPDTSKVLRTLGNVFSAMHLPMSIHCGNGWTCGSVHFCCFEADFVVICHMGMKGRCLLC